MLHIDMRILFIQNRPTYVKIAVYTHFALRSDQLTLKCGDTSKTRRGSIPDRSVLGVRDLGNTDRNAVLRRIYTFCLFVSDQLTLKCGDTSKTRRGSIPDRSVLGVRDLGNTDRNAVLRSIYTFRLPYIHISLIKG